MSKGLFATLKERGYIYQFTSDDETEIEQLIDQEEPFTFYLGIDPTADSLHIGHFFALTMFRRLQEAGHRGVIVIGGATAAVGDPSGKSDMRKMLTSEQLEHNIREVKELIGHFVVTDGPNPAIILNNMSWFNGYSYIDFMREIGIHFNVNTMLAADAYANRLKEGGLTFLEMGYMLMQAYDFAFLNENYGCRLQIGGSDQWGNILAGARLHKKRMSDTGKENDNIIGVTCPLLLTKDGKKMGKTENGALWVARDKTTPYDFYQYFYNVDDADVEMLLKLFTDLSLDEIAAIVNDDIRTAKQRMAYEITKLVHGKESADEAVATAQGLFGSGEQQTANAPTVSLSSNEFSFPVSIVDVAVASGLFGSKGEVRRMIGQNGLSMNGNIVTDVNTVIEEGDLEDSSVMLRRGKKKYLKVRFE